MSSTDSLDSNEEEIIYLTKLEELYGTSPAEEKADVVKRKRKHCDSPTEVEPPLKHTRAAGLNLPKSMMESPTQWIERCASPTSVDMHSDCFCEEGYCTCNLDKPDISYLQATSSYLQAPSSYHQAPSSYHQAPSSYLQAPSTYLQAPSSHLQAPSSFLQAPSPNTCGSDDISTDLDNISNNGNGSSSHEDSGSDTQMGVKDTEVDSCYQHDTYAFYTLAESPESSEQLSLKPAGLDGEFVVPLCGECACSLEGRIIHIA